MFCKLVVLFGLGVILTQSAPLNPDLYKELLGNPRFYEYYQQHVVNNHGGEQNDANFGDYLVQTIANFRNWQIRIRDSASKEYRTLVFLQRGNTVIPTEEHILLNLYLESLYLEAAVEERTRLDNQVVSNSVSNSQSNSAISSASSSSSVSLAQQSQNTISNQNIGFSKEDLSALESLDSRFANQINTESQLSSSEKKIETNVNSQQISNSANQIVTSTANQNVAQNTYVNDDHLFSELESSLNQMNRVNNQQTSSNNQVVSTATSQNTAQSSHVADDHIFGELESSLGRYANVLDRHQIVVPAETEQERVAARVQSHNARYNFATSVDNNIEGNYLQQVETRRDGRVFGKYSYDDGNNFVTRYYIADDDGFRIVKEIIAESKKHGQQLNGEASVQFSRDGQNTEYHITEHDIHKCAPEIRLGKPL